MNSNQSGFKNGLAGDASAWGNIDWRRSIWCITTYMKCIANAIGQISVVKYV